MLVSTPLTRRRVIQSSKKSWRLKPPGTVPIIFIFSAQKFRSNWQQRRRDLFISSKVSLYIFFFVSSSLSGAVLFACWTLFRMFLSCQCYSLCLLQFFLSFFLLLFSFCDIFIFHKFINCVNCWRVTLFQIVLHGSS